MSNTVALGVVKLLDYTIATGDHSGRKFYFSASSPDKSVRTYYFATESEMDRKRWGSVDYDNNISPPPFPPSSMPSGILRVQAFDHIHILIILAVKNGHFNKNSFFACEVGVCRVERGSLWWGGEGACDVGRGAAST